MSNQKASEKVKICLTDSELSDLAEQFYLGKISANHVVSIASNYADFKRLKTILKQRMNATAKALCKVLDDAAFDME